MIAALVMVGCARIATTWHVFSDTYDEGWHIAAGMQWLDKGTYTYERKHPPLGRIAAALGPWLRGRHAEGKWLVTTEGQAILLQDNAYAETLALARAGMLPFFGLAVVFVWLLTRRIFGIPAGLVAAAVFSSLPPILAHAGLATTDMPLTGTFATLLFAGTIWLEEPTIVTGMWLGAAAGITLVSKFSAVPFFAMSGLLASIARWRGFHRGDSSAPRVPWRMVAWSVLAMGVVAFFVTWSVYRFSINPVTTLKIPLPLRELIDGFRDLAQHNREGHPSFILGHTGSQGVWYFFPVTLLVKTPLPILILAIIGFGLAWRQARERGDWRAHVPLLLVAAIMIVAIPSRINIGVRHILPVYLGVAAAAGFAAVQLWIGVGRLARPASRACLAALVTAHVAGTSIAHPDYLAYFNVLAGREPARVLVVSDLDWGQDLLRLGAEVRKRGIDSISVEYFGAATRSAQVPHSASIGDRRPTGWFAISETNYRRGRYEFKEGYGYTIDPDYWKWLRQFEPVSEVGKSIRLYHLP